MNKLENFKKAIRFDNPSRVPPGNEDVWFNLFFENNAKKENWIDLWGVEWECAMEETSPFPHKNPIASPEAICDYVIPDPDRLVIPEKSLSEMIAVNRSEKMVMAYYSYPLYDRAWALMGMENFMMALLTHPDECRQLLRSIAGHTRTVFRHLLDIGVDAVHTGEDLGTQRALMISPALFREFILPEYKFMFQDLVAAGKIINFHSCGTVYEIVEDLASAGVSILNPIQAKANDLHAMKKASLRKIALWGGIDSGTIMHGKPGDVRDKVKETMAILKPGGGYVCAPDQYFPNMPEENMKALWDAVREFGAY